MNLTMADKNQLKQIKKLYKLAFPRNERKPFWLIKKKERQNHAEILAICDGKFLGLAISLINDDMVLLDYFAIDSIKRGKGIGSEALRLIKERYAEKRLILEIESPDKSASNNEERIKRKMFYLKNGFTQANIPVKVFGVNMELLTNQRNITFSEYQSIYVTTMGRFLKKIIKSR